MSIEEDDEIDELRKDLYAAKEYYKIWELVGPIADGQGN